MGVIRAFSFLLFFALLSPFSLEAQSCGCGGSVPTHTVDLTGSPDTTWSVSDTRQGYCCGTGGSTRCIKFEVSLHPNANQLSFDVQNPSPPGGAFYQVNCGAQIPLDSALCVQDTASPFCITYCKSGNDNAQYVISSSQGYGNSGDVSVRQGCTDSLYVQGMNETSIQWTSVYPGADGAYDGYLACQDSCDTTFVSPPNGAPDTIRYEVSGELSGCSGSIFTDTLSVYTFPGMTVDIVPDTAYVCPGGANATLGVDVTGGAPPYSYNWSNGSTDSTMTDGVGDYQVSVSDTTDACPAVTDSGFIRQLDSVPTPTPSSNSPVCGGDTIELSSDSLSGVSYHWYGPNGFTSSSQDTNILNAALSDSGTYYIYADKDSCSSDTNAVTVDVNPQPSAPTASSNAPICGGDTLQLSATSIAGASYSWTGPNGFSSTQQNPTRPDVVQADSGYYQVSVTVNGCASDTDSVSVSISPQPSKPTASSNSPVCVGNTIDLSATNLADADYYWNGPNGYNSTQQNPSIGNVTLSDSGLYTVYVVDTITGCDSDRDSVIVDVDPAELADAGPDDTACADAASVPVNGSTSTGSGSWSTLGDGSFTNPSSLSTDYSPGSNDSANGGVELVLSSTNNGACGAAEDTLRLTLKALPVANAGADVTVCANAADVNLNGSVSNASGGFWVSSGDGTFDNANNLSTVYHAGPNDTANGSVDLSLITTGNSYCDPDTSSLTVTITDAPVVEAGADQSICSTEDSVDLNGNVSAGSTTGQWSTLGDGTFDDPSDLTTDYVPGSNDTANGSVDLVLTSTNNGDCNPVTDTMTVTFIDPPVVDAGNDTTLCANNDTVPLNGSSSTGSGQWSSSGSGSFANATALNTSYYPSDADTANGSVTLTLVSTNNGTCEPDTSSMTATITDAPHPYAGPDDTVCANNATATLNGSVYVASGGVWSTTGDGSFVDSTLLNTSYTAGPNDTANGSVQLVLTSTGNGDCYAERDTMELTIHDAPIVNAGSDQLVCKTQDSTTLNGSISGPTNTGQWSTLGDGTFDDPGVLTTDYNPGSNDTANGFVDLVLTSTNNEDCNPVTDTMRIEFFDGPRSVAGPDDTVCANKDTVALDGYSNTGAGAWFSSGSGTFADPTDTNTTYDPSDADTANGSVVLSLETTNNGSCVGDTSSMTLTITDAPHPYAGMDDTVCANNATDSLQGEVYVASGGVWSTAGDGSFSDSSSLNTSYTAGPNDTANGSVELYLTTTGNGICYPETDTVLLTITDAPTVDAGSDMIVCKTDTAVTLNGSVSAGSNSGQWSTLGDGSFDDPSVLNTAYHPGSNDTASASVDLVLTSTNNGDCLAESDTVSLDFIEPPVADAGNDTTVCANNDTVPLNGSSSTGSGMWFSSGSGTFASAGALNTVYDPSDADTANGSVDLSLVTTNSGTCDPDTSTLTVTITDAPHPDAGPDDTVCANNATASLNGQVSVASGGVWSTAGDGSFADSSDLSTTYTAGPNDTASGSVELYLTSTGNGDCYAETDTMLLSITDAPVVDAGPDTIHSCLSDPTVSLNGSSSTGSGQWSSTGSGSFLPSNTDLNADYEPSSTDTANGYVSLILQSTNNANCLAVQDTMVVEFVTVPSVNAGTDTSLCANNDDLPLDGQVWNGSTTGEWSTSGSGAFSPSDSVLDPTYIPSNADTAAGSVDLILTATQACEAISDTLTLAITDAPVADAGPDLVRCKNNPDATLSGDVYGGSSTGVWSTYNGSGTFSPDSTVLNATYSPSSSDTAQGYVDLVLTTTNNQSNCLPEKDTMRVVYTEEPVADAGSDQLVCADHNVDLNGSITGGSGEGQWSTPNGTGTFLPSDTALQGSYSFSAADTTNGNVTLVLSSINNGNCNADTDTMDVTITPAPGADAGNDTSLCANNDTLPLNGNVSIASGGEWSTTGDGSFLPHDSSLTASYAPGPADDDSGSVTLILSTTGNGICYAHHDSLDLTLDPAPQVDAGASIYICEGDTTADLNGSVSGATNTGVWSSSGTGNFDPSNTALTGTYQMSDADTAAGSVLLTLTSTNNGDCYAESDSVEVTVTTAATVTAESDTTLCTDELDSLALNGSVSGGSGNGEWSTNGFGSFYPSDTADDPNYIFDAQDTSMNQVILSFASVASCVNDTDSVSVDLIEAPIALAGPDMSVCEGQQADLNGSVLNAWGGVWNSSGSGNFLPDDSTLTADYLPSSSDIDSGDVALYLSTYGGNVAQCGSSQDTLRLELGAKPVASFSMDPPCVGEDLGLSDSSYVADDSIVSHQWVIGTDSLSGPSPSYSFSDTGTHTIQLTVTSSSGCQDTVLRSVSADPQPTVAFAKERLCDQEVQFHDSSSVAEGSIVERTWTFGDGDSSSAVDPLHSYMDTGSYGVTLTVTSDSGCTASSTDSVRVLPDPIADFEPRGGNYDPGEAISFEAFPKDAISYLWDFDDGHASSDSVYEHFYEEKGSYGVKLVVEDSLGCRDSVSYTFSIGKDEERPVAIPTAFTPNGDGENDVLRVLGGPMKEMDFRVYNEWGNELFVSKEQSKGWDGTVNGKVQPAGSYVFILKGVTVGGKKIERRGKVHLIR